MSESGLKKRNVAASSAFESQNAQNFESNSDNEVKEESDEYDADSKETRLTLMEEILLLGLKDREVRFLILFFKVFRLKIKLNFDILGLYFILE